MKKILALLSIVVLASGCLGPQVPTTRIKAASFEIEAPKDSELRDFHARRKLADGSEVEISIGHYKAKTDAAVVQASGEATANQIEALSKGLSNAMREGAAIGARAVVR